MSKSDVLRLVDYLAHITEAIDRIHQYVENMTELTFLQDPKPKTQWCATSKSWVKQRTRLNCTMPLLPLSILRCLGP